MQEKKGTATETLSFTQRYKPLLVIICKTRDLI